MSNNTSVTVTAKEAAAYMNISYWTLLKLVRTRRLPNIRIGSRLYFKTSSLDKYLSEIEQESLRSYNYLDLPGRL